MTDATETILQFRLVLQDLWNNHCWRTTELRDTEAMHEFERLTLPLYRFFVRGALTTFDAPEGEGLFGPAFSVVPQKNAAGVRRGPVTMSVNSGGPGVWKEGIFEVDEAGISFHLIDFFNWRQFYWRDYSLYRVKIDRWDNHEDKVGLEGLIPVLSVDVLCDTSFFDSCRKPEMSTQAVHHCTTEQYLRMESAAEVRSEFLQGGIYAMARGTVNHARIVGDVFAALCSQLPGGSRCEAFSGDLRVFAEAHNVFTYPDVVVVCGTPCLLDDRRDTITDARLIVEVLSPSTSNYDRGGKFRFYRSLPSFSEYLLIAQDAVLVEHHVRQPDGAWNFREFSEKQERLDLKSIGCHLSLAAIYERVEFEA